MRGVYRSILLTLFVAPLIGCGDRDLRPLTPCTTSGASGNVPIEQLKNVDLVFLVDNSNSMASEQQKLRNEFPNMIRALATGDIDGDMVPDGPAVESLRVAVITSDMGVLGNTMGNGTPIQNCGAGLPAAQAFARANYGDDGVFRTQGVSVTQDLPTVPVGVDCDQDNAGGDDAIPVAMLPEYLTFDPPGATPTAGELTEFNRRVSCLANVGVRGCVFEQQLEAMLKAITPAAEVPEGGPFHAAASDVGVRDRGHGDDPLTNDADPDGDGVGWFRDDSLLALVMVTDEEDCSARDPGMFDLNSTTPPWNVDGGDSFAKAQTRCTRFEDTGLWPISRYIRGFMNRRSLSPGAFVFAAITGVPPDLTDEPARALPNGDVLVEGTDNLDEILADSRMQYTYVNNGATPMGSIAFACEHFDRDNFGVTVHGDATSASTTLANVTVQSTDATPVSKTGMGDFAMGATAVTNVTMSVPGQSPEVGMSISGTGIVPGTIIVNASASPSNPLIFGLTLSQATTSAGTGAALTIGASLGPAQGNFLFGTGISAGTRITSVTGTGPYTLVLNQAITTAANADIEIAPRDVEAAPARRAVRVAQGITGDPYFSNATIQSICVDDFGPAMARIITLIQENLRGSCLPRSLIRNAQNEVNCDVFVTLPPGKNCGDADLNGAYAPEAVRTTTVPGSDTVLQVCRMLQVPVTAADRGSLASPTGHGWFYDDYTDDADLCGTGREFRVSFTEDMGAGTNDTPPQGSRMSFSCAQPVQDGDLAIDINAPCNGNATPGASCVFPNDDAAAEFILRYNVGERGFTYALESSPGSTSSFLCEYDSNTCQIACQSDAQCPGGFVCYDDPNDDDGQQAGLQTYCVNPVCGAD